MIVLLPSLFNDDLGFMPVGKDPAIKTFSTKRAVETLDKGIFSRTADDAHSVVASVAQPLLKRIGDELRHLVLSADFRHARPVSTSLRLRMICSSL